ncbi:MAG: heavy metal-responsive transcriptional regulator [Acidobacteria bacterium]|nr:heavy metal-responsive transcriptional regulator [Acidobacteriota bacterium]
MPPGIQIGRVAKEIGLTVDAIRFYEKQGLLKRPARSEGRFRLFSPEDVRNLKFIRKAQELGFSLLEIRELLVLQQKEVQSCVHVRDLLKQKLTVVRQKIDDLQTVERNLKTALQRCNRRMKHIGELPEDSCPVLEEIRGVNGNKQE